MSIPGFSPAPGGWQSTVPGWVAPSTRAVETTSPLRVELDGRVLETGDQSPRNFRDLVEIQGWWDGVDPRGSDVDAPGRDGSLEGRVLLGARPITINGHIHVQSRRELLEAMEWYGSVLQGAVRRGALVVTELDRDLSRRAHVRCVRKPVVVPDGPLWASVMWHLEAADPIRYSDTETSVLLTNMGPDQGLRNVGDTPVKIGLELTGPLVTPSFWIGGAEWRLAYTIPAGRKVNVTWGDRSVMYGNDDLRFYQSGPWPLLPPGVTMVGFSAVSGTGTCKVTWRSGWL